MTVRSDEVDLWRMLAEAAPDYLCIVDRELRYVWVNRIHPSLTREQVIGRPISDFATDDTAERAHACLAEVIRTGEPSTYLAESIVGDQWIECRVLPIAGEPDRFMIATRNVTDQRRAEVELRERTDALRKVVQMYPQIMVLLRPDGTIVDLNDATAAYLGATRQELLGTCAWTHMDPEVGARRREFARIVTQTKKPLHEIEEHRGRWFDSLAYPLLGDDGLVHTIAIVARDVTDQRKAEDILREHEARRWHAEKMEALGTLAAGVAHDFNNLLTPIAHNAAHAARPDVSEAERRRMLGDIEAATARAAKLVRQILAYGRDDVSDRCTIDVRATVAEVSELIRASLPASVNIAVDLADEALWIEADVSRIQQALTNLCINASQAMDGAGTVTLTAHRLDDGLPVELEPGHYVRIAVRDTGPGIPAEALPRIFEPFYSTKAPDQGSGLGLFVVHGVATSHGGTVSVTTSTGDGTEFALWLPAQCSAQPAAEAPRGKLSAATVERRVLLLDDEPTILTAATATLEIVGHTVTAFARAAAALAAFRAAPEQFDVAVLDQRLVDGVGLDVAATMREIRPELPILLCSGHLPADVETVCKNREIAVLAKPYDVDELLEAIDALSEN